MRGERIIYKDARATLTEEAYCFALSLAGQPTKYYTNLVVLRARVIGRVWPISWKTAERIVERIDELIQQEGPKGRRPAVARAS